MWEKELPENGTAPFLYPVDEIYFANMARSS